MQNIQRIDKRLVQDAFHEGIQTRKYLTGEKEAIFVNKGKLSEEWKIGTVFGIAAKAHSHNERRLGMQGLCIMAWVVTFVLALFGFSFFGILGLMVIPVSALLFSVFSFLKARSLPKLPEGSRYLRQRIMDEAPWAADVLRSKGISDAIEDGKAGYFLPYISRDEFFDMSLPMKRFLFLEAILSILGFFTPMYLSISLFSAIADGRNGWYNWIGTNVLGW